MELCHNARIKRYPDGSAELLIGSRPFGGGNVSRLQACLEDGDPRFLRLESSEDRAEREYRELERDAICLGEDVYGLEDNAAACHAASVRRSVRRARKVVRDIARSNDWAYFVTLTLSPDRVDRYDFAAIWKHLRHWLGNCVRRKGLVYLLVPEHHKDGAIHFHGFFNDALEAVDSGTMSVPGRKAPVKVRSEAHRAALEAQGGHTVYNLPGWGWGFSTAIQLYGEKDAAVSYVCKYIGKEMGGPSPGLGIPEKIGGRWYYSGGALERPTVEWFDVDLRDWEGVPGWYQPETYPYASFLTLRITAEGEVVPPYISKVEDRTDVSCETDAKHDRGSGPPLKEGATNAPEHSAGYADGASMEMRPRESSAAFGQPHHAALETTRPARNPANFSQLTILGLSTPPAPPAPQPPGGGTG